jgi:hypothetical protein
MKIMMFHKFKIQLLQLRFTTQQGAGGGEDKEQNAQWKI